MEWDIPSKKRRGKGENFLAIRVSRLTIEARYRSEEKKRGEIKEDSRSGVQPRPF